MHCKYKGCKITTKNGQRHSNWAKWQLCKKHAWELHSDELSSRWNSGRFNKDRSKKK